MSELWAIHTLEDEVTKLRMELEEEREIKERWRRHASHLRGQLIKAQQTIFLLEFSLEQNREAQTGNQQAGFQVDLPDHDEDDVDDQHEERQKSSDPSAG